jgi:hypothetical protein
MLHGAQVGKYIKRVAVDDWRKHPKAEMQSAKINK